MTFPLLMAITSSEEQPASFFKFFFFDLNGVEKDMFFGEFNGAAYINLTHKQRSCDESNSFFFLFFLSGIMPERVLTQLEKCPVDCAVIEGSYTLYVRKRKEATTKLTFCFSARSVDLKYRRQLLQPFASSLLVNEENSSMCYLLFFFCVCVCVCVQKWISRTRCNSH